MTNPNFHIYNYSNTGYTFTHAPYSNHLIVETTDAIYYVSADAQEELWKYDIATHTDALITTRTEKIQALWHDRTNGRIWGVDCDNDGVSMTLYSWYITYATDTITSVGNTVYITATYVYDIFIISNVAYIHYRYGNARNYIANATAAPFVDIDSSDHPYVAYKGVVRANQYYTIGDWTIADVLVGIQFTGVLYNDGGSLNNYSKPNSIQLEGISYDSNYFYFIAEKDADSKNYLCYLNVLTFTLTDIGIEYNTSLMLDRNTLTTNPIPFNLEKAFDINLDVNYCAKVYQIGKGRANLYAISQLQLGVGDSIVAVTDTYLVVNDSGTIQLWEYVDFISYLTSRSVIRPAQRKYWTCDLYIKETGALGDFLGFFDGCWVQIIGNLSSNTNTGLISYYNSPDNFLDQEVGDSGTDIAWVDSATLPNSCTCTIIESLNNHKKVLKLTHDGGASNPSIIHTIDVAQPTGTWEWWWASSDVTRFQRISFETTHWQWNIYIWMENSKYYYYNSAFVVTEIIGATPTNNIFAHFKIKWDISTDKFDLYINGVLRVNQGEFWHAAASGITIMYFSNLTNAAYSQYISAPADVADNNYYEGQNQVKTKEDQVIFEGYLHTSDLKPLRKCWVDSPSLFDLKKKLTAGTYGAARTDENIVSIIEVDSNYIVEGTMANGTAAITTIIKGSKALQTQLNSYGQLDGFTFVIKPDQGQGLLMYNDGTVSSGVRCSQDEKIKNVQGKKQRAIINQVTVKGAINIATGVPYTGTYDDEASQRLYGVQPITRTFANLYSDAACLAQATAILTIQQYVPYTYTFAKKIGWEGLVLPSETILLEYTPDSMIESGTRIINSLEFYFRAGICKWNVEDAISYTTEMDLLKQMVEENSDLIEQLAATMFTLFTTKKLYYVSTDAELDAAITAIQTGVYSATIILTADLTDVQATINNASIDITIDGQGHTIDSNGDNTIFTITSVHKIIFKNIVFDASAFASPTTAVLYFLSSTYPSSVENCVCYGPVATKYGYFVNNTTANLTIKDCKIYYLFWGFYNTAIECHFLFNKIHDGWGGGIYIGVAAHDCLVLGNNIQDMDRNHATNHTYGILVVNGADRIRIESNHIDSIINSAAGNGYGILIEGANSDNCIVVGNGSHNCKTSNYTDSGTSTTAGNNDTT